MLKTFQHWYRCGKAPRFVRDSSRRLTVPKEEVDTIASERDAPVLPGTIVGHLMTALASGLRLDLDRLPQERKLTKSRWL